MKRILPAYPLWIIDPMFSVWSNSNELNGSDTVFWTGLKHKAYGLVRYDGKTYCFMGRRDDAEYIQQTDVAITAFDSRYTFECDVFILKVRFISPRLLTDLKIMSCPVCFTEYDITPKSGRIPKDLSVAIVMDEDFCYDGERAETVGGVLPLKGYEAAYFTRKRNMVLSDTSDMVAPDWGSTYITGDESFYITDTAFNRYVKDGVMKYFRTANERNYIVGINKASKGYFVTAFDDFVSIFYFGEWLKGYFFKDGATIVDALNWAQENHDGILEKCETFDKQLKADCDNVGNDYYLLACASLRQSVGAHKLVENKKGDLLFLSKECNSNGCIGTADVSYPSMPLYLIYNPELVNAMLVGIYDFARMLVWNYDFAPHDLGTYPWCAGQSYSVSKEDNKYSCGQNYVSGVPNTKQMLYLRPAESNVYSMDEQMPVEECGNMLIMTAAAMLASGRDKLAKDNFDLLQTWVNYLEKYGLQPEFQLCTDDFAGHLANNVNLAIKALVGIESFALICRNIGEKQLADEYTAKAFEFARQFKELVGDGIMPLAYGQKDTYSLKYNILFDKLFGFELIGQDICERETDYYIKKTNKYGVPLDTRKNITKSDWILWVAALTDDKEKCEALYSPLVKYLAETPSRVPFGDLYGTEIGEKREFYNRTVQGGNFAPLLKAKFHKYKI